MRIQTVSHGSAWEYAINNKINGSDNFFRYYIGNTFVGNTERVAYRFGVTERGVEFLNWEHKGEHENGNFDFSPAGAY